MKQSKKKLSVGVLASGSGTDLQSIIDASESGLIDAKVVVVISDRSDAYALSRAKKHQIPGFFVNPDGKDRTGHESEIDMVFGPIRLTLWLEQDLCDCFHLRL